MKKCKDCNETKDISEFAVMHGKPLTYCLDCKKIRDRAYYKKNKERFALATKRYREANHEAFRESQKRSDKKYLSLESNRIKHNQQQKAKARKNRFSKYAISSEDYEKLFEFQGGKCAICKKHQDKLSRVLHIDHSHKTNKVRGLLCASCNTGIGLFQDNPELLESAKHYLEK